MTLWSFARLVWSDPGFVQIGVQYNPELMSLHDKIYWKFVTKPRQGTSIGMTDAPRGTIKGSISGNGNGNGNSNGNLNPLFSGPESPIVKSDVNANKKVAELSDLIPREDCQKPSTMQGSM